MRNQLFLFTLAFVTCGLLAVLPVYAQEPSLTQLFTEPTSAEIDAVRAEWGARDVQPYDWQTVGSGMIADMPTDIVSHTVSGDIHYGVVRLPENYDETESYPILITNHGGTSGMNAGIVGPFSLAQSCFRDFFVIAPSFSGEPLDTGAIGLGVLTSEGDVSEFDGDIDDVLALLNGTIANYAGANAGNINLFGASRGGAVTYLLAIREPRIRRAVVFFGATDHMTFPGLETVVDNTLTNGGVPGPFYNTVVNIAREYMNGTLPLADARAALLSRSVIHFIDSLPDNLQIHHGDEDSAVPVANSQLLDIALTTANLPSGAYTYYEYPGGGHGPNMPDSVDRRNDFLCEALNAAPTAVTGMAGESSRSNTPFIIVSMVALILLSGASGLRRKL